MELFIQQAVNYLIIWLSSIGVSFAMKCITGFKIFKDMADNGYKPNMTKINYLDNLNYKQSQLNKYLILIPGINILNELWNNMQYNSQAGKMLDQLRIIGALEPMSPAEIKEYEKRPTAFNSICIAVKSENDKNKDATTFCFYDDGEESTITFTNKNGIITIIASEGPVSTLSKINQRAKVLEKLHEIEIDHSQYSKEKIESTFNPETGVFDINKPNSNCHNERTKSLEEEPINKPKKIALSRLPQYQYSIVELSYKNQINYGPKTLVKKIK